MGGGERGGERGEERGGERGGERGEERVDCVLSTPLSKGRNLAGSPLTLDKFEASMAVSRENKQHSPPNERISRDEADSRSGGSGGAESESGSGSRLTATLSREGGELDSSSYDRQLRHHHQTTLRELAHARAACTRMSRYELCFIWILSLFVFLFFVVISFFFESDPPLP